VETQKEILEKKAEEDLKKYQESASKLEGLEVTIPVKVGKEDQLFESITPQKVSEKIKELGINVKKSEIDLINPIKELGEFPVKIKFNHNLEIEIKIVVVEEK
jgi:large subunit ribosomal protein L9